MAKREIVTKKNEWDQISETEIIIDPIEQLKWLENRKPRELNDWFTRYSREGFSSPLVIDDRGNMPQEILYNFYSHGSNAFKKKLRKVIKTQIIIWNFDTQPYEALAIVLALVGLININDKDVFERIQSWVKEDKIKEKSFPLKGKFGIGVDLHYFALRVIFGFRYKYKDLTMIARHNFQIPEYAPLCFRVMWEQPGGLNIDPHTVRKLFDAYYKNSSIDINGSLNRYLNAISDEDNKNIAEFYLKMLASLDDKYIDTLDEVLVNIDKYKIEIHGFPQEDKNEILYINIISIDDLIPKLVFPYKKRLPTKRQILKNELDAIDWMKQFNNDPTVLKRLYSRKNGGV